MPPGTRRIRAGFTDSSSTSRGSADHAGVHQPVEARAAPPSRARRCRTARGRTRRSSRRRGAARGRWRSRRRCRRRCPASIASRSAASRSGGFILVLVSYGTGAAERLVGEREVVRRHLAGDADAALLALRAPRRATAARSCARCGRGRRSARRARCRARAMIDSAAPGMPRRPERATRGTLRARRRRP